jgi:excisionase family DNA binding protein
MIASKITVGMERTQSYHQETPLLLSVPEAARLLGVGVTLGWEMVHGGQLPSVRLGRRVLVPRAAIEHLARLESA